MVQETWEYKLEEKQRDTLLPKNSLEFYAFNMTAKVEDENLPSKINDEDKQKIPDKCNKTISLPDKNQTAKKKRLNSRRRNWTQCATHHHPSFQAVTEG